MYAFFPNYIYIERYIKCCIDISIMVHLNVYFQITTETWTMTKRLNKVLDGSYVTQECLEWH